MWGRKATLKNEETTEENWDMVHQDTTIITLYISISTFVQKVKKKKKTSQGYLFH